MLKIQSRVDGHAVGEIVVHRRLCKKFLILRNPNREQIYEVRPSASCNRSSRKDGSLRKQFQVRSSPEAADPMSATALSNAPALLSVIYDAIDDWPRQ